MLSKIKKLIPFKIFKFLQPIYHFVMAWLAAFYYRFPSNKLIIIGVTGTTGKTSTVYLIAQALEAAGWPTGYTSTAQFSDGRREWLNDKKMTMPGRFFLQKLLRQMINNGCRYAVVETTSQGIEQFRHRFINYDTVVVTGLYPEHIEAHGSFANYKRAKGKLCQHLSRCTLKYVNDGRQVVRPAGALNKLELNRVKKTLIVNGNDEHAAYFLAFKAEQKIAIIDSQRQIVEAADKIVNLNLKNLEIFPQKDIQTSINGTTFSLGEHNFNLKLWGDFQADNASLAALSVTTQGADWEIVKTSLENINSLAGKLEKIDLGQEFIVLIDYAFEPVALEKLYEVLKNFSYHRLIHVLGSTGGGRDQARRPKLGQIAGSLADIVIVTNEDPYDEDPEIIIQQVAAGAFGAGKKIDYDLFLISDRRQAIKRALTLARPRDLVLITGKGAEQYICLANEEKMPWDDRRVAKEELAEILKK